MIEDIAIATIIGAIDMHYLVRKWKHNKEQINGARDV